MKEFDKWWLMEAQNIVGVGRANEEDVAESSWKAALEWVKSRSIKRLISVNEIEWELNGE